MYMSPEVDKIWSKHQSPVPQRNVTDGPYFGRHSCIAD